MNVIFGKKTGSSGRARAHSMLSMLKAMDQERIAGDEPQPTHPGISAERLHEPHGSGVFEAAEAGSAKRPSIAPAGGRVESESHVSALTMALQAAGVCAVTSSEPIAIAPVIAISAGGVSLKGSSTGNGSESDRDISIEVKKGEADLRNWCTGMPPKKSFLGSDGKLPVRLPMTRRSTLADKPELDVLLAATKVEYNDHYYVPLTSRTIHRLSPYWKGEKPLADTKLLRCIVITHEVNDVHADHVVAAMERIGEHCKHLLVMSPVQTSELGNVFNREAGNVNPGNDWDHILRCFPNLEYLAFVHPADEPVEFSRNTFYSLRMAVAKRQATQQVKRVYVDCPPALLTCFQFDMATALGNAKTT